MSLCLVTAALPLLSATPGPAPRCLPWVQGVPFCFSAQLGGESILAWDLRAPGRCLYELATGNNDVVCLQVYDCCCAWCRTSVAADAVCGVCCWAARLRLLPLLLGMLCAHRESARPVILHGMPPLWTGVLSVP